MISNERFDGGGHFEGGGFHPDFPDGRASGKILLDVDAVRFRSEKGNIDLPADGLQIEAGGASDRLIFFKHAAFPAAVIHTADRTILGHPLLAQNPALAAQRAKAGRKKTIAHLVFFGAISALLGSLVLLYVFRGELVEAAASGIPVEWEIAAGDKLFESMMASERVVVDPELSARLAEITGPLVAAIPDKRYPFKFHIVENPTLNAFAMPGGNVVLHTGLLLAAESPEEIAGVLAHEIAHVTRRHGIRGLLSSAGLFIVAQTLLGDMSGLVAVLADNSTLLLNRGFSRDFEREADNEGWEYLLAANIRPEGMIRLFERLHEEEERQLAKLGGGVPEKVGTEAMQWISTHPATRERMAYLRARWEKLPDDRVYQSFGLNYGDFEESIRRNLHSRTEAGEDTE